jgi:hypothetical protein
MSEFREGEELVEPIGHTRGVLLDLFQGLHARIDHTAGPNCSQLSPLGKALDGGEGCLEIASGRRNKLVAGHKCLLGFQEDATVALDERAGRTVSVSQAIER